VYIHKDNCIESHNAACKPCNLWSLYLANEAAHKKCEDEMKVAGHWCDRRQWITLVQVENSHYVALPNQAVTGVEEWFKVAGVDSA
jgi:hypothetical protein